MYEYFVMGFEASVILLAFCIDYMPRIISFCRSRVSIAPECSDEVDDDPPMRVS